MTGVEPANNGSTNHCRNHLATPTYLQFNIKNFIINIICYIIIKFKLSKNVKYYFLKKNLFQFQNH